MVVVVLNRTIVCVYMYIYLYLSVCLFVLNFNVFNVKMFKSCSLPEGPYLGEKAAQKSLNKYRIQEIEP